MRFWLTGVVVVAMLSLSACSGGGSSPAAFCAGVKKFSVQFAGLQDNHPKASIEKAADAIQQLAEVAPSQIKSAVETEAATYRQWAKTGNPSVLTGNAFSQADAKISAYESAYCKQN